MGNRDLLRISLAYYVYEIEASFIYLSKTVDNSRWSNGTIKFLLNNFNREVFPLINRCLIRVWYSRCCVWYSCDVVSSLFDICRRVLLVIITGRSDVDVAINKKKK